MDEQELRGWSELDPVKRAAHFIRMNDIVVQANAVIPLGTAPGSRRAPARFAAWS